MSYAKPVEIRLPGPTEVPPRIQEAIRQGFNAASVDYRNEEFRRLLLATSSLAARLLGTANPVVVISGSGTAVLEATLSSLTSPGHKVIVCDVGHFGELVVRMARRRGLEVVTVTSEWGESVDLEELAAALTRHPDAVAVFATHCETSTGVVNDVQAIGALVRDHQAVLVVDAVSSLAASELRMDEWAIDVVCSASQKALMLPPGLALASFSRKASDAMQRHGNAPLYFDLPTYASMAREGGVPFTPNVPLVYGLHESLKMILDEGIDQVLSRHRQLRDMTRQAVLELGLECFVADDAIASSTLTVVRVPDSAAERVREHMVEVSRILVGAGLGKSRGKVLRLGHLGYVDAVDVRRMIHSLWLALEAL